MLRVNQGLLGLIRGLAESLRSHAQTTGASAGATEDSCSDASRWTANPLGATRAVETESNTPLLRQRVAQRHLENGVALDSLVP